jgi:hypothetical protein
MLSIGLRKLTFIFVFSVALEAPLNLTNQVCVDSFTDIVAAIEGPQSRVRCPGAVGQVEGRVGEIP